MQKVEGIRSVGVGLKEGLIRRKEDMHESGKATKDQHARIAAAVQKTMPRALPEERTAVVMQISEISSAATERLAFVGTDDVIRHTRIDHEPPVMTLRDFDALGETWQCTFRCDTDRLAFCRRVASMPGSSDPSQRMRGSTVSSAS